jgi:hypothetical protein
LLADGILAARDLRGSFGGFPSAAPCTLVLPQKERKGRRRISRGPSRNATRQKNFVLHQIQLGAELAILAGVTPKRRGKYEYTIIHLGVITCSGLPRLNDTTVDASTETSIFPPRGFAASYLCLSDV